MSNSTARCCGNLLAGLLVASLSSTALAERAEEGPREESWQIEQRQIWFEESRGLREQADAGRLRAAASAELKREREQLDPLRDARGETWEEIGPSSMNMVEWIMGRVSGRLNAIAPVPGNEDTVYVGSAAGGVWKTTNGGQSWLPIFDQVGTLPIGAITLDPLQPNTVWVGTGDKNGGGCAGYFGQGVYLSEDGGTSWAARNGSGPTSMPLSIVNAVAVQPNDNNVILVGGAGTCSSTGGLSGAGVYRSVDKGLSWSKVLDNNVEDILFVPGTATVYAGLIGLGAYKSVDGGANWTPANSGMSISGSRLRLAMAPSNSDVLYALNGSKLFRSGNGGLSWTQQNAGACEGQCSYNQTLSVHPTNPDTLLVGTIRFSRSTNAGLNFTPLTSSWGSAQRVHQDTHVVLWSRTRPNRFWVGSDGGIWRTDDGGDSYVNMNANINITQFYDIAVHPSDANIVFGGAQDNSSSGRRTNLLWDLTFASGDGFMNALDENDPSIVFQTSYPSGQLPYIVRSFASGSPGSFTRMSTSGMTASSSFPWVTPLTTAGSQLFVASNVLYRASTTGNSWTPISPNLGSAAVVVTARMQGALTPAYVGTSAGRIYSSADAGIPSPVFVDVTGNYPGGVVSDIAMDPIDPQRVFITRAGFGASRLYRSTSGGASWTAVGLGLPNVPANAVAIDPLDGNRLFVGTDIGVYESVDGGNNFSAFSAGLPLGLVVSDLEIDDFPHVLSAGTYSRGAWRMLLNGSVGNTPPTADFAALANDLEVAFSDTSIDIDGSVVAHDWDFGDASAGSTESDPVHAYAAPGSYTVALTVTDDGGLSASYAKIVRIAAPPVALVNGVVLANQQIGQGEELRYTLDVPSGATDLRFQTSGVAGEDADLSVYFGGQTVCQSAGPTSAELCVIANPQAGTYTASVFAFTTLTSFSIVGSYVAPADEIFVDGFD
jgi:hypothetical protein